MAAETTYKYAVLALSQDGDGAQSAALSVNTPTEPGSKRGDDKPPPKRVTRAAPGVPLNLAVVPGDTQLTYTWDPPASDGGSAIAKYNYEFGPSGGTQTSGDYGTNPTGSQTLTKTGLTNGTAYTFKVRAINTSGSTTLGPYTPVVTGTPAPDTTPPSLVSALVKTDGGTVLLVFSENFKVPQTEAEYLTFFATLKSTFSLTADGSAVSILVSRDTSRSSELAFTISPAIQQNQAVVFSYTDPTSGDDAVALEDALGNETPSFTTGRNGVPAVTNTSTVADTKGPAFASAAADGTSLVITFYENLAAAASLANSAFTVKKTPSGGTETTVTLSATAPVISGKTVTLTLATALVSTDTAIKVSYTKPTTGTANKLVDAATNETGTFTDQTVTNNTPVPDTTPPTLTSARVSDGGTIIDLVFSENVDHSNLPPTSAFSVTADGIALTVSGVRRPLGTGPKQVWITVLPSIRAGQAVIISYTDPTSGNDTNAIQDTVGNDAASFTTGSDGVPAATNASIEAAVVPGVPTSLNANPSSTTRIDLSWNAPADNGGRVITGYKIEVSSNSGTTWTIRVANTGSTTTTYAHTGLTAGTARHYRVSAINSIGTGAVSTTANATTPTRPNNLPTSRNATVTVTEDTIFTFSASHFFFSDSDSGDTLASVNITELPAAGKGTLGRQGTVTKAELDAGQLTYSPPANAYGTRYASFKFKVNDSIADSAAEYTMTINVTNVNDVPTGRPTISGSNEVGNTLTASTSDIIDPDGLPNSFTYQWKRFAADGTTFEANIGTNSSTYTLTDSDEGKRVKAEVSFTDNGGTNEGPLVSDAFPSSGTVTVPTSDSLNVGGLGVYWHGNHDNGGNMLRMDSCTGVKVFRVIWDGPEGNRRADQWTAEITSRGGSRALRQNFRETPGNPGYFELDGRMLLTGPDSISIRVRGRFGSTWGTWSPRAGLYCFAN